MKRFLFLVLVVPMIFVITSCSDSFSMPINNGSSEGSWGSDQTPSSLISLRTLSQYRANIIDATALGISRENVGASKGLEKVSRDFETKNYLKKSTTTYSPGTTQYDSSGLTAVTFTRVNTDEVTEETTGEKDLIASAADVNVEIISNDATSITIKSDEVHEYRIKDKDNKVLKEWTVGNSNQTVLSDFVFGSIDDVMIEARSLDASISFMASDGFTYSVYGPSGNLIIDGMTDNCNSDAAETNGIIQVNGLIMDEKYKVKYHGRSQEIIITQDDIDGEIDKIYVLGDYTFISFVPSGTSARPSDANLQFDTDGISVYDKKDYFTNDTRQSFIIDNRTGYIYAVKDFNIKKIEGGCLLSADDNFIYDFKINDCNELEIYSLFSNDSITYSTVFKDKYGHVYINNNRLNMYDPENDVYFYVFHGGITGTKYIDYNQTSGNEAVKITYTDSIFNNALVVTTSVELVQEDNSLRSINVSDSFDIFYHAGENVNNLYAYKVEDGILYGYANSSTYTYGFTCFIYDSLNNLARNNWILDTSYSNYLYGLNALEKYNILFEYNLNNNCLYYYDDAWSLLIGPQWANPINNVAKRKVVIDNCSISDDRTSFLVYDINGNTYYDIIVEAEADGNPIIKSYVSGTYTSSVKKIILQPLNK